MTTFTRKSSLAGQQSATSTKTLGERLKQIEESDEAARVVRDKAMTDDQEAAFKALVAKRIQFIHDWKHRLFEEAETCVEQGVLPKPQKIGFVPEKDVDVSIEHFMKPPNRMINTRFFGPNENLSHVALKPEEGTNVVFEEFRQSLVANGLALKFVHCHDGVGIREWYTVCLVPFPNKTCPSH